MDWSQTYPGLPAMVSAARAFVRSMLHESPRVDDAVAVTSELVTNSLRHTPSGGDGGQVTVTVSLRPAWARVAVSDAGTGEWNQQDGGDYGRGLVIVDDLADKSGHDADGDGQTAWAEFGWSADE